MCKFLVYIMSVLLFISSPAFAGERIELEPVIITSTRIYPEESATRIPTRSQDSVIFEDSDGYSNFSVTSILKKFSLTDARTRGPYGVQADISLRGAPFEQNLVLLDGISLNDPKTGHHNMDLPLTLYDIERIDVTYGPASSVYGSGALGGALNIIPRKPDEKLHASLSAATGSWDFLSNGASLNLPLGALRNRSSVEWKRSTGYAPETEFDILTTSSYSEIDLEIARFECFLGYHTKKFGAGSFYSNLYPNEAESVNTGLLIAKAEMKKEGVSLTPTFYWKRLQDKFILDRNREFFSRNDHTTHSYGGEISSQLETEFGKIAFGTLIGKEEISSTNIGGHHRLKNGSFLEYENRFSNFLINASGRLDYYSTFGFEFCPSLGIGYEVFPELTVRASAARSFRAPTFTDLYYSSAANKGNPDLIPEKAWTYDAGINYVQDGISASGTIFLRNTDDIIDWTRASSSSPWQAENIGEFDMFGFESLLQIGKITFKYAYLEALDKKGVTSKYALEYLKHNLNLNFECDLPFGFKNELNFSFRKRMGDNKYFLLDSTLSKDINFKNGHLNLFLKINNILNTRYREQDNIKMPSRSIFAGINVKF